MAGQVRDCIYESIYLISPCLFICDVAHNFIARARVLRLFCFVLFHLTRTFCPSAGLLLEITRTGTCILHAPLRLILSESLFLRWRNVITTRSLFFFPPPSTSNRILLFFLRIRRYFLVHTPTERVEKKK